MRGTRFRGMKMKEEKAVAKTPFYKKKWFIPVAVVVAIIVIGGIIAAPQDTMDESGTNGLAEYLQAPTETVQEPSPNYPVEIGYVEYADYTDEPLYIYAEMNVYYSPDDDTHIIELYNYSLVHAVVARVIDGDTIELADGERVRLIGVDAPEMGFFGGVYEPGATEATEFVRSLVYGETVWLEPDGNDSDAFGRLRRYVWLQYPADTQYEGYILRYQLNALLLVYGHAEVMIIGSPRNEALFRYLAATPQASEQTAQTQYATGQFIGNRNTHVFHISTCRSLPAPQNRIHFETRDDAVEAGHRPCGICRP